MRATTLTTTIVAGALLAQSALAQCVYRQPWTEPRASHTSRVVGCQNPFPMSEVAMDDFVCENGGQVRRIRWDGVLLHPDQRNKPYYVAIYSDENCRPTDLVADGCTVPRLRRIGLDCEGNRVFRFTARFPVGGVVLDAQKRYWFQVSEVDNESAREGAEDFRWSAHRPIKGCPAVQRDTAGMFNILLDNCDNQQNDLAFAITTRSLSGTIGVIDPSETSIWLARLIETNTGEVVASHAITPTAEGFWEWWPQVEPGQYTLELNGMGAKTLSATVDYPPTADITLNFEEIRFGDVDGDNSIALSDLAIILSNFGL